MSWITLKTANALWEAELMQQVLASHNIPSRIIETGVIAYFGAGSPAVLQVRSQDQWTALLLLSSPEEDSSEVTDNQ
ncbi:MAG: hypothetical protein WA919_25840 [Coleofasciculaceae cyanobacterium]